MHLFNNVHYALSSSLSTSRQLELSHVLDSNGATGVNSVTDTHMTHLITNSNRCEGWQDIVRREKAQELTVVTDKWVDRSMLLGKLQPTTYYSADPAMVFSGVVACAAELPTPDLEVLSAGITALGGQWRTGLTKDVTHLFVISPSSIKYSTALHFQEHTHIKVLLPHWFDDAVRLGMGALETAPYEWPDPPLLKGPGSSEGDEEAKEKQSTRQLDAAKKSLYQTASLGLIDPEVNPSSSFGNNGPHSTSGIKKVWNNRRVLLSTTLELIGGRREAVEVGIRRAGGTVVGYEHRSGDGDGKEELEKVDECDVFVTRYRSGKAYVKAVRQSKTIGTLPWVFHVQSTGVLSPPMDQLLHYPIPKRSIEGFGGHEITITNYTGESREYLKKLIMTMGATFTPSMTGKNTVLIAAYISGTKTTKAASWSIPIVNHTWLEDCFVRWRNLTVALEKYIVFPPGVDFATMLGERGVGRGVEDVTEEELEALEEEDDEGEGDDIRVDEGEGREGQTGQGGNVVPVGTEHSARDAREVEDVETGAVDDEGDSGMAVHREEDEDTPDGVPDEMDVDEQEEKEVVVNSRTKGNKPNRLKGVELEAELVKARENASGKKQEKNSRIISSPSDEETVIRVSRRKSGKIKVVTPSKGKGNEKEETSSDDNEAEVVKVGKKPNEKRRLVRRAGERYDSWISEKENNSEESTAPEEEEAPVVKSKGLKTKGRSTVGKDIKSKSRLKKTSDDDEDEEQAPVSMTKSARVNNRRSIGKDTNSRKQLKEASDNDDNEDRGDNDAEENVKSTRKNTKPVGRDGKQSKPKAQSTDSGDGEDTQEDEPQVEVFSPAKSKGEVTKESVRGGHVRSGAESGSESEIEPVLTKKGSVTRRTKSTATSTATRNKAPAAQPISSAGSPTKTPKRVLSVLMPPLTLATKASPLKTKDMSGTKNTSTLLARTGSMHAAAGERFRRSIVTGRPANLTASGLKSKPIVEESSPLSSIHIGDPAARSSKRSAASKASQKLRDEIMPDVMNFQLEMRNQKARKSIGASGGGGVTAGGTNRKKRVSDTTEHPEESEDHSEVRLKKKRKLFVGGAKERQSPDSDNQDFEKPGKRDRVDTRQDESDDELSFTNGLKKYNSKAKKASTLAEADNSSGSKSSRAPIKLMTTQVTLSDDVVKTLTKLGVKLTTRSAECTHLLASNLVRTEKFLCALAAAPFILTPKWATDSAAAKKLLSEKNYTLHDIVNERKYDFVLAEAIARAEKLGGKLFAKKTFYITPRVPINNQLLQNVINACGGQATVQVPTVRILNSNPDRHIISCPEDASIWRPIAPYHPIYTHELLLTAALKQEMDWDNVAFRVEGSHT